MVSNINGNTSVNWYQLLNSLSSSSQGNSQDGSGFSGIMDTADISQEALRGAGKRKDPLEQLVNAGTITSDQATAIHNALQAAMESSESPDSGNDPLAGLVSAGTITQDQASSVKSTLDANRPGQGGGSFLSNVLDNLVSSGTISQDQENSVKQAMMQGHHHHHGHHAASPAQDSTDSSVTSSWTQDSSGASAPANPLDTLVSSGVITQDQEDTIRSSLQQAMDARRANAAYSSAEAAQYGAGVSI